MQREMAAYQLYHKDMKGYLLRASCFNWQQIWRQSIQQFALYLTILSLTTLSA